MAETETQLDQNNTSSVIIDLNPNVLVRVALLGLGLGVVTWAITMLLSRFVIGPVFCPSGGCSNTEAISGNIALVLASISGMLGLVRLGVYRPMLVALAVVVCLWNIGGWLDGIVWYEAVGWAALITMVAYVTFAWLVRPRNIVIVVLVLMVLLIAIRYVATL